MNNTLPLRKLRFHLPAYSSALQPVAVGSAVVAQQAHVSHAQAVERAKQVVARMTLDEKITQLHGIHDADALSHRARDCRGWAFLRSAHDERAGGSGTGRRRPADAGYGHARADCAGSHVGSGVGARVRKTRSRGNALAQEASSSSRPTSTSHACRRADASLRALARILFSHRASPSPTLKASRART